MKPMVPWPLRMWGAIWRFLATFHHINDRPKGILNEQEGR